jgi:oligopeptide transport system substrate-binding protein
MMNSLQRFPEQFAVGAVFRQAAAAANRSKVGMALRAVPFISAAGLSGPSRAHRSESQGRVGEPSLPCFGSRWRGGYTRVFILLTACLALAGCGRKDGGRVAQGNRDQILYQGNASEPQDLDPQIITGVSESHIMQALFEGLVSQDPKDLHPIPGVAERWDISPDGRTYTFHLRKDAKWSNGEPVTSEDFVRSYERILSPKLAAQYAEMFYVHAEVVNAREFYEGKITDFKQVGFQEPDPQTLIVNLKHACGHFLAILNHQSWYPVHIPTVLKFGKLDQKSTPWTRPGNLVGNGPFRLKSWEVQQKVVVEKSPTYWDAANVRLKEIHYLPIENLDTEEHDFRSGQLHVTYDLPQGKIDTYRKQNPQFLRIDPYLGIYFYRLNVTHPALKDKRVRRALAMSIDRAAIVKNISRGGQQPASNFTPPDPAGGYVSRASIPYDVEGARKLLVEAGFPEGKGLAPIELLINTSQNHQQIAEAIQQMWRVNLGIETRIVNQEWKVYLDTQIKLDYCVSRSGWIGDYNDPFTFLGIMTADGGNNNTGFKNADYDRLIGQAAATVNPAERMEFFQQAEAILLDEAPVAPIYFYTRIYLKQPSVKGWYPNILDVHMPKFIYLDDSQPAGAVK